MNIKRKFDTAKKVFTKYGIKQIAVIIYNYITKYSARYIEILSSRIRRGTFGGYYYKNDRKDTRVKILYITERMEVENGQTVRYRIYNLRKAIRTNAKTRFEIIENGIYHDQRSLSWPDLIILMRVEWSPMVQKLIDIAKSNNKRIVYDIDDIIFKKEYVKRFCKIISDDYDKNENIFEKKFQAQEMTYLSSDFTTTSTNYIADLMRKDNKSAFVIHNGFNQKQIEIAGIYRENKNKQVRSITYLSGSVTHNIDFLQALPSILKIMYEYPDVILKIVGYLDIDTVPQDLQSRVITLPFMKWTRLLKNSAKDYINIAPLDISNPFCHAKSELKYFEAAIVGVPTIASATDTYKRCITHGLNGMLAWNDDEWYTSLKTLLDDKNLYNQISKNAYDHVMEHYSPEAIAKEAMAAYKNIIELYKMKQ